MFSLNKIIKLNKKAPLSLDELKSKSAQVYHVARAGKIKDITPALRTTNHIFNGHFLFRFVPTRRPNFWLVPPQV